jgi:hypothetical protein
MDFCDGAFAARAKGDDERASALFRRAFDHEREAGGGTEKLAKAGQECADTLPPVEALRAWMMLFVDFIADKQIMAPALNALLDDAIMWSTT